MEAKKLWPFTLSAAVVLLDQITKAYIVAKWPQNGIFIKDIMGNDFLWIIHVRNKAIAFSLGERLPDSLRPLLFIILPLGALVLMVLFYLKTNEFSNLQRWALAGILGGGVGNIIDRIFRPDGVVDFISVKFYGLFGLSRWPTFNLADSSVVVCGIIFVITVFFLNPKKIIQKEKAP